MSSYCIVDIELRKFFLNYVIHYEFCDKLVENWTGFETN